MNDEKYQGLNLPQLLDLLHDIVVPEVVSWLPQTRGWWVLIAWVLAVAVLAIVKWVRYRRRNAYRREALDLIDQIDLDADGAAAAVAGIVKRTALVVYPRNDVAALYGEDWARFLVQSARNDGHVSKGAGLIADAAYRPGVAAGDVAEPAKRWIRVHRA